MRIGIVELSEPQVGMFQVRWGNVIVYETTNIAKAVEVAQRVNDTNNELMWNRHGAEQLVTGTIAEC